MLCFIRDLLLGIFEVTISKLKNLILTLLMLTERNGGGIHLIGFDRLFDKGAHYYGDVHRGRYHFLVLSSR